MTAGLPDLGAGVGDLFAELYLGAALSGEASVTPKTRNGPVEQMRVLLAARRSARTQRIGTLNQLRHLVFTAPEPIRVRYKDRYKTSLVAEAANMKPRKGSDPVIYTTNLVIRNLARRVKAFNTEMKQIDRMLISLLEQTAPSLLALYGVGPDSAASLLVAAGDNSDRISAEGSWARLCAVSHRPPAATRNDHHPAASASQLQQVARGPSVLWLLLDRR